MALLSVYDLLQIHLPTCPLGKKDGGLKQAAGTIEGLKMALFSFRIFDIFRSKKLARCKMVAHFNNNVIVFVCRSRPNQSTKLLVITLINWEDLAYCQCRDSLDLFRLPLNEVKLRAYLMLLELLLILLAISWFSLMLGRIVETDSLKVLTNNVHNILCPLSLLPFLFLDTVTNAQLCSKSPSECYNLSWRDYIV